MATLTDSVHATSVQPQFRVLIVDDAPVVLLLTARHEESNLARGFGYGANDYLAKPFLPFELALRVEKMLAAAR